MNKKKKKLLLWSSIGAVALTVGVVALSPKMLPTAGDNGEVWNHYSAVAPTLDTLGCKEYWVNCGTHEHQFTAPTEGTITDKGALAQKNIDSLNANDDRLVAKSRQVISFENDTDIDLITCKQGSEKQTKTIVSDDATDGSKCLKLVFNCATADFQLPVSYLDKVFADPNVVAVNFDAKSTAAHTYFAYLLNGQGTTYEGQSFEGYGITTFWKTFSFTRSHYETYKGNFSTSALMWTPVTANETQIFIDNFRPVMKTFDVWGAEGGRLVSNAGSGYANKASLRNYAHAEAIVMQSQNETATYGFDFTIKSEGNKSLHMYKDVSKYVKVSIPAVKNAMSDTDVVSIDIYTTSAFNSNKGNKGMTDGRGNPLGTESLYQHKGNRWVTYSFTKSQLGDYGEIIIINASTACDVYVDNVRINANTLNEKGFETDNIIKNSSSIYSLGNSKDLNTDGTYTNYEDYVFRVNGDGELGFAGYSKAVKSEGNQSFKMERTGKNNWMQLFVGRTIWNAIKNDSKKLSFDLYSTVTANSTTAVTNLSDGNGNRIVKDTDYFHPAYEWKTYTLDSDQIDDSGRFCMIRGSTQGDWYIDNIALVD